MGIITEISQQKNKKRVNLFVDNEFRSGLNVETAVKFGLKTGRVIDDVKLDEIIMESETMSAFDVSLNFLSLMPKSEYEVKQKLFKKGFSKIVIESTIEKLREYHYVDDQEYAKLYISSCSKKSKREIENKLRGKGVKKEIIDELLADADDELEEEKAIIYANKYIKNKVLDEKTKRNLIANLVRRGYSYDLAIKVLDKIEV